MPKNDQPIGPSCVLRDADPGDDPAGADDADGLLVGGQVADGLEDLAGAALGEFQDGVDAVLAAFGDHVGGPELAAEVGAGLVPAHQDDPLGAELLGRQHGQQPHRAVADDRDGVAGGDAGAVGGVPAGAVHVGQGQQRGEQALVGGGRVDVGDLDQGAVGQRHADGFGLAAGGAQVGVVPESAVDARGLQSGLAELAHAAGDRERGDDEIALRQGLHRGADRR